MAEYRYRTVRSTRTGKLVRYDVVDESDSVLGSVWPEPRGRWSTVVRGKSVVFEHRDDAAAAAMQDLQRWLQRVATPAHRLGGLRQRRGEA